MVNGKLRTLRCAPKSGAREAVSYAVLASPMVEADVVTELVGCVNRVVRLSPRSRQAHPGLAYNAGSLAGIELVGGKLASSRLRLIAWVKGNGESDIRTGCSPGLMVM